MKINETDVNLLLEIIAATQGYNLNGGEDFPEVARWKLRDMLAAAYEMGLEHGNKGINEIATEARFEARVCTRQGWQTIGEYSDRNTAYREAAQAASRMGLDPAFTASAKRIN